MAIIRIEGKSITVPDEIVTLGKDAIGKDAIRAALSVDFPVVGNAQIEIVEPTVQGAPSVVTVTKRATPKGAPETSSALIHIRERLADAPPYVNPAIRLAHETLRAEGDGDAGFFERARTSGAVGRAIIDGAREAKYLSKSNAVF